MDRLEADVAGVRVAVTADRSWLERTLAPRYRRFSAAGPGAASLDVRVVEHIPGGACPADSPEAYAAMHAAPFVDGLPDYPVLVEPDGARLRITSLHLKGWFDPAAGRGEATCCTHDQGAAENFLRVAVARLLLPQGGFLLHACAVVSHGEAIVGFGPSGAGKTTLASMAGPRSVISDDLVVLRRDAHRRLVAVPTLFRDGGAPIPPSGGYRVRRLLRLRKTIDRRAGIIGPIANRLALRTCDRLEGARELLAAMPFLTDDAECASGALALADAAAMDPGVGELTFPLEAPVWTQLEAA